MRNFSLTSILCVMRCVSHSLTKRKKANREKLLRKYGVKRFFCQMVFQALLFVTIFSKLNRGGMAEWSNAAVLKTVRSAMVSRVRIPVPPPHIIEFK